jgi:hypothetical protein
MNATQKPGVDQVFGRIRNRIGAIPSSIEEAANVAGLS